ncbi:MULTISPECIES: hypothetical protein [unclassified Arenibacter]|uniref:hypothetical protein n=1 Tax=unclassified Arenibacter TaxID=2615047 RepID=UPI000E35438E|nr:MULTISPECIES: hypothetical protein [unclassified Arenibacter]MCM4166057.1 hypothetical protein [Arenibacter sp. A80]RFT54305.1 hypothetical protein D0S24_20865 [Arenibacter sp. P308M17]
MNNWYHITTGQFGYPQPENDFGYLELTYEPNIGCPTCHIGIKQNNPFRFKNEPKAKNSQFIGLNWVFDKIFVREPVKTEFEKNGITGISFSRPIFHKSEKELESIYQLHVDTILPEALISNNLTSEKCEYPKEESAIKFLKAMDSPLVKGPFCGQIKYNFPQGKKMTFDIEPFKNLPDFVRTFEWFGSGASANRPILISEKVKRIIELNKWRGTFLDQIELKN